MDTCTFYTYARANRINAVIKTLYSYFGTLTGDTGDIFDTNQAIVHLRYFLLKQSLQEERTCTTQNNLRVLVLVIHLDNHCAHGVTFAIEVCRNLILLGQIEFIVLLVKQ